MEKEVAKNIGIAEVPIVTRLSNYAAANPLTLITAITAFGSLIGGLLILIYLVSEHYFPPDMSMSSIGTLLGAAAIGGVFITLFLMTYLVVPGLFYRHVLNGKAEANTDTILSDRAIIWLLDVPSIFVFVGITTWAYWPGYWLLILIVTGAYFSLFLVHPLPRYLKLLKWKPSIIVQGLLVFIPWFFILLIVSNYEQITHDDTYSLWIFIEACAFAVFANHLIAGAKKWWLTLIVPSVLLFLLLMVTQQFSLIPHAVARMLTLGNIQNVTLLLDEQGCEIATQYSISSSAGGFKAAHVESQEEKVVGKDMGDVEKQEAVICSLSPVNLIWRIGSEYFVNANQSKLYVPTNKGSNKSVGDKSSQVFVLTSKFAIPSSHVLSWTVVEPNKSGQK